MKRQTPVVLTAVCWLISMALLPTGRSQSIAFTHSLDSSGPVLLSDSPAREPQQKQTAPSREKSRSLVHKGTETKQSPELDLNDGGPQAFAVIIGISTYKNLPPKSQLEFADQDATAIRDFLVGPNGGFKHENVDLLVNEQARQEAVLRALEKLQNKAGNRDLAFIFFAGHGIVKNRQGFVLTYDSHPEDLLFTAVEMDRFNSLIKNVRARSVVIFTDACHSGTIGDLTSQTGGTDSITNLTAKAFADIGGRMDQTSFIFSAASPTQSSWELGPLRHGLFTHYVIKGLGGKADRNGNGVVTADELYDYVATNVRREAEELGRSQVPEFNSRYDRSIPLAFLNEAGQKLYKEWFDSDSFTTRYSALFDEALNHNYLIKPEQESAWDYYNMIKANVLRTPPELIKKMREELLAKLTSSSQAVIDQSPSDPLAWEDAAARLGRAHELSPEKHLRARQAFCTAMSARHSGENGRAERECDTALTTIKESNLKEPPLCFNIAQLYRSLQKLDKARDSYKLAIDAEPRVDWICEYAEVLKQLKDLAEANSQLRVARTQNPRDHRVLRLLAEVLVLENRAEQFSEAVDIAREARQIKPNDVDIEEVFGWALLKAGRPGEALEPLRKVAELRLSDDQRRDDALLRLAQAYSHTGDLERSVSALREAERRASRLPELYDELSRVLEQQGDLDGAIAAAERASALVQSSGQEKAMRVRRVAEYMERTGRINEAIDNFKDAARHSPDVKVASSLEAHAAVLSYRAQRFQDAVPVRQRGSSTRRQMRETELLILPGGREPLQRLTGVIIKPSAESQALAVIFDTCLQDSVFQSRLVRFYEKYKELVARLKGKGFGIVSGSLPLPAVNQNRNAAASEVLDFFGVEDKNGRRILNKNEFAAKKVVLEALGGDPQSVERGEGTLIKLNNNDECWVPLGMDRWARYTKDMAKAPAEDYLLQFLKDTHSMRFYVGLAALPEDVAEDFADRVISRENWRDVGLGVYFAAPFLRFSPEGHLVIPGQRSGEINWQRLLKLGSSDNALKSLLKKDNAELLYLFAALSSAGEVGDFIARSSLLDDLYRALKDSSLPDARESLDLIDLLSFVRVENNELRLSPAVELWLTANRPLAHLKDPDRRDTDRRNSNRDLGDPIAAIMRQIEKTKVGRALSIARLIAALDHIERERPDWVSGVESVDLIVKQLTTGRESQLELALDLQMSLAQLQLYLSRITRVDAISTPALKQATACVYQAAFELLRIAERNGVVSQSKIVEAIDLLLDLDPSSERFAPDVISILRHGLLDATSPLSGPEFEKQLIAAMGLLPAYVLQDTKADRASADQSTGAPFYRYDASKAAQERISHNLGILHHTRLRAVVSSASALDVLAESPSDADAIQQLKAALAEFVEPEPPPPPKKAKSKQPVVRLPTMKEVAEQLTAPVPLDTREDLRRQIMPFLAQSLLGIVYAVESNVDREHEDAYATLVLNHDMSADAWGNSELDGARKSVRGGLARLGYALAILESGLIDPAAMRGSKASAVALTTSIGEPARLVTRRSGSNVSLGALFTATVVNSFAIAHHRLQTTRAVEFVTRSIDLGEEVLGLFLRSDQTARTVVDQLDQDLTPRRAQALRAWLNESEIKKALNSLSLSELYSMGQRYFAFRLRADSISNLVGEPGALGAMASAVAASRQSDSEKDVPEALRREIRQFGMTTTSRTGLMRLDLRTLEPYEQSLTVGETSRLIERLQDFKLSVVRACYRRGHTPLLALNLALVRTAVEQSLGEMGKGTGRIPPDRAWQDLLNALQVFDEASLTAFIEKLASSGYASPVVGAKWNVETARRH